MLARITLKGLDAESYATKYSAPVRRGLEAIHFLNTTTEKAAHNYAPGKSSGLVVGSPVAQDGYLSTKSLTNFIQTDVTESDSMTIFCIARTQDLSINITTRPAFYGTYKSVCAASEGLNFGVSLWHTGNGFRANASFSDASARGIQAAANLTADHASRWSLYVHQVGRSGVRLLDSTHGLSASAEAPPGFSRQRSKGKFIIGGVYHDFQGCSEIALWQAHSEVLSDDEIVKTVDDLRAYAKRRDILV